MRLGAPARHFRQLVESPARLFGRRVGERMRREVVASYLKLAGVLLAGLIVGRFGLPRIEPQTTHYVTIFPEDGQRKCPFGVIDDTSVLGRRIRYGED